jgi:hypothetical protein
MLARGTRITPVAGRSPRPATRVTWCPAAYTRLVAFACPSCGAAVAHSPESWLLRCDVCGARLRSRALESEGPTRAYEIEAAGRPDTRTRVEVPWDAAEARRLRRWLVWSTAITLGLVGVLLGLVLLAR